MKWSVNVEPVWRWQEWRWPQAWPTKITMRVKTESDISCSSVPLSQSQILKCILLLRNHSHRDKELSTLWFYRYWIFSVVYSSSKGRLPELTINREIWIVIIPKNSISYLSDPSDLLIAKNRNISFNLIQNALHLCETTLTSQGTFYTLQPNSKPIGSGQIMKASYTSVTKLEIWSCCIVQTQSCNNQKTRRYPWGIQRLVSTHQLPHKSGDYSRPTQIQSAKICPNFHFRRGGGWWGGGSSPDQHSWNTWVEAMEALNEFCTKKSGSLTKFW